MLVSYSAGLLARRLVLGSMISAGLLVIIGTELRHALTDEPHDLSLLAFGVSLVLLPVVTAAISSIVAARRLTSRARSSA
ncbi:hypothetical protein RHIZ404_210519 [Rhizobium sp. EC-SD404]|nr:hypothetical protein RHIZ404_210519 [Rhizobium sp. EC-SD404]